MSTQDDVTLTERERQQLADMEARLEAADPRLARALRGRGAPAGRPRPGRPGGPEAALERHRQATASAYRTWGGPVVVLAGLALILCSLAASGWLSVPGSLVVAGGLGLWAGQTKDRHLRPGPAPVGRHRSLG